ncbi:MAG: rRNA pseudouridine synthase [Candidatus Omnitrophica bacterium]|nr:rRNA pseudouridine synthase [Candidatus Omnitrophota bacterium]
MRISRALALGGLDSRRKCEAHVLNGAVTVNGEVVKDLGRQVDPEQDTICFRGRMLHFGRSTYYLLNKPEGYTTTAADVHAAKTVFELLPRQLTSSTRQPQSGRIRVFPVGRLDRESSGLLLFTNDGEVANRLTHPRYGIGKWYEVRLHRPFEPNDRARLFEGIRLVDGLAKVEKLIVTSRRVVRLLIREGKKHEVRRIFDALDYGVVRLTRLAMGPLTLGSLPQGTGRFLKVPEIAALRKAVFLDDAGGEEAASSAQSGRGRKKPSAKDEDVKTSRGKRVRRPATSEEEDDEVSEE